MTTFRRSVLFAICILGPLLISVQAQNDGSQAAAPQQSLADVARKLRKDTTDEVKMTDADTKKLFEAIDRIFDFAVEDTGMPKHSTVKRQLVSKADVEKFTTGRMAKEEFAQRFAQGELSMKKLGFLPRDFNLREFLVKSSGQGIAAFYDEESKSISMLNWVPSDRQEPILAHELTHALQDQNYDLKKWMRASAMKTAETEDGATARKAVVEGQAMVVYVDYLLKPIGRNLADTPGLVYQMEEPAVKAVIDSQMMHDAPMILREMGTFAYNQGLIFEGEVLHKGGKNAAFAGVFARPPRSSHEVLEPDSYLKNEKLPPVRIPDMKQLLSDQYEVFDSGGVGELDVRALLKQYGERKIADDLATSWQGGSYVTYRRLNKNASAVTPTTSDLALLYVSRWKTPQAAQRFARFYVSAISQRYRNAVAQTPPVCTGTNCPVANALFTTEEGPVIVEQWADNNSVVVSESFDTSTAAKLREAAHDGASLGLRASDGGEEETELGFRFYELPAFRAFEAAVGEKIREEMAGVPLQ